MVIKAWSYNFVQLLERFVRQLEDVLPETMKRCLRQVSLDNVAFLLRRHRFWIRTYFRKCLQYLCLSGILVEYNPHKTWSRNDVGSPTSTTFTSTFHIGSMFRFNLKSSTYTDKTSPFSRLTNEHSQFGTFSQRSSNRTFSNCLSQKKSCQRMTVQISLKRNDWIFHAGP